MADDTPQKNIFTVYVCADSETPHFLWNEVFFRSTQIVIANCLRRLFAHSILGCQLAMSQLCSDISRFCSVKWSLLALFCPHRNRLHEHVNCCLKHLYTVNRSCMSVGYARSQRVIFRSCHLRGNLNRIILLTCPFTNSFSAWNIIFNSRSKPGCWQLLYWTSHQNVALILTNIIFQRFSWILFSVNSVKKEHTWNISQVILSCSIHCQRETCEYHINLLLA